MTDHLPLREQMKALEHLQEIDFRIDNLNKKRAALPDKLRVLNDLCQKTELAIDTRKNSIGEIEKLVNQTSAAVDLNNDRLTRAHSKLEAVHNSQEFQAANKEIDQLKKLNANLDEQLKKSREEIDILNQELVKLEVEFDKVKAERQSQMGVNSDEATALDAEIKNMSEQRTNNLHAIDVRLLRQYDRVRLARGGMGCVPAVGGRCSGCHMSLPPQLFNEVYKAKAIQSCPSCHRILLIAGDAASSAETTGEPSPGQESGGATG